MRDKFDDKSDGKVNVKIDQITHDDADGNIIIVENDDDLKLAFDDSDHIKLMVVVQGVNENVIRSDYGHLFPSRNRGDSNYFNRYACIHFNILRTQ